MLGSLRPNVPDERRKQRLLELLEEGHPPAIAESLANVNPGTVKLLIELSDNEIEALNESLAVGEISYDDLEGAMVGTPLVVWGLRAREAGNQILKKAYQNVNAAIVNGNLNVSRWFIARHVMTEKDQALVELLKIRAHNDRLSILTKIRAHSESAYRTILKEMNLEPDTTQHHIKQLNAELRRTESAIIAETSKEASILAEPSQHDEQSGDKIL